MRVDRTPSRWREGIDVVAAIAFIALCTVAVWALVTKPANTQARSGTAAVRAPRSSPPPLPKEPIAIGGAAFRGAANAKVAIIAYSEFKCPYCGAFARDTFPTLAQKYLDTGKVRFVFRHFPLDTLHPFAREAAKATVCAERQGKFWKLHDLFFADQAGLDSARMSSAVKEIGLDPTQFSACMGRDAASVVQLDQDSGQPLGITGTPTFFVGIIQSDSRVRLTERLGGAMPLQKFETSLDKALKDVEAATK